MRNTNTRNAIILISFLILIFAAPKMYASGAQDGDEPLLTIGCLTDLHCEYGLINCQDVNDVHLRKTTTDALRQIRETENVDILLLGGDYTSLVSTTQENWLRARQLLADATRAVFRDQSYTPVVYANGNHEYEAPNVNGIPKGWNSGDYYTYPMKEDIGELSENDCFYEYADNGNNGRMKLLAAYYYRIRGVDFVVLNTGKYLFAASHDYSYSSESVEWCGKKIESLYLEDPNRLIIFLAHIPFGDSNSISKYDKGLRQDKESTSRLKSILAKYPEIIMLYGHDHGGDKAYTSKRTSQRITRYDTDGNVISAFDSTHVDGVERAEVNPEQEEQEDEKPYYYFLKNVGNGKYLGRDGKTYFMGDDCDLNLLKSPQPVNLVARNEQKALYGLLITHNGNTKNLSCGSNGNMSVKDRTDYTNDQENGYWFHVDDVSDNKVTATRAKELKVGEKYIIVYGHDEGGDNGYHYYMVGNSLVSNSNYKRIASKEVYHGKLDGIETLSVTDASIDDYIYILDEKKVTPSFLSVFMGSMRYHGNSIDKSYDETKEIHDPRIAQALMIYIYADRIEFRMKNYGETGSIKSDTQGKGPVTINEELVPYTVFRAFDWTDDPGVTGISQHSDAPMTTNGVYDISGRLIPEGKTLMERGQLPAGIYIMNGHVTCR